jgi:hypothetical protein
MISLQIQLTELVSQDAQLALTILLILAITLVYKIVHLTCLVKM